MSKFSTFFDTAVIPVTDSDHTLLPIHFSFDPGPDFVWDTFVDGSVDSSGVMSYNPSYSTCLNGERKEGENLDLLKPYLELVKVPLPEWLIDHLPAATAVVSPPSPSPAPPNVSKQNIPSDLPPNKMVQQKHHQEAMYPNQIVSVAYSEPNHVVDVNYVEQHDRRNRNNQVGVVSGTSE